MAQTFCLEDTEHISVFRGVLEVVFVENSFLLQQKKTFFII